MFIKAELISYMGTDLTVVNAARVSFDKQSETLSAKDEKLIGYLARNKHWTPFAHPQITIRETLPIFVARQRIRHTIGFAYNEVSRRYVTTAPTFLSDLVWRAKSNDKKQGSEGPLDAQDACNKIYEASIDRATQDYQDLLDLGVCPEQARMVLPLALMTSWYVTGSLAAWARAYNQRKKEADHAQHEITLLAEQWDNIIRPLFPISWNELIK